MYCVGKTIAKSKFYRILEGGELRGNISIAHKTLVIFPWGIIFYPSKMSSPSPETLLCSLALANGREVVLSLTALQGARLHSQEREVMKSVLSRGKGRW